jgi:hypothetical protein
MSARRVLTLRRIAATGGLVVVSVFLSAAACAPQNSPGPGPTTSGTAVGGTSGPPPTTAPPAVTYPSDAETYAKQAVTAWETGDTARLNQLEVAGGTIHTLAGCHACYDLHFNLIGSCDGAAGSSYCLFYNKVGDSLRVHLSNPLLGHPQAVVAGSIWDPITFPSDDKKYAQEALDAWLGGNDARLKLLTASKMTSAQVDALGADRHSTWTFDHADGAMGSTYYNFHDLAGHSLAFRFLNGPPAPTTGPASQHRITEVVYLP